MTYFDSNKPAETLIPSLKSLFSDPASFFADLPIHPFYRNGIFLSSLTMLVFSFLAVPFHGMATLFLFPISWAMFLLFIWAWARYLGWSMRTIPRLPMPRLLAFNIASYCAIPLALLAIPYIGLLGPVGSIYLLWQALVHRGKVNSATALMMSIVPAAVLVAICAVLWIMMLSVSVHIGA